jgi:hypothetical protein
MMKHLSWSAPPVADGTILRRDFYANYGPRIASREAAPVAIDAGWEDVAEPNESVVDSGVTLLDDSIHANYQPVRTFGNSTVLQAKEG